MRNNGKNFSVIILTLVIVMLFFSLIQIKYTSAVSPQASYIHVHCNINTSFIEENLCEEEDCSPIVNWDGSDYLIDHIWIRSDKNYFDLIPFGASRYNLSKDAADFLIKACEPNISSVLNYVRENIANMDDYCDFYPYYPTDEDNEKIVKINKTWYLVSSSYSWKKDNPMEYVIGFLLCSFLTPIILFEFFLIGLAICFPIGLIVCIIAVIIIAYLIDKSKLKAIYLIPILFGLLGSIIGVLYTLKKYKDKKMCLKMLTIGLLVSLVLFIFYYFFAIALFLIL